MKTNTKHHFLLFAFLFLYHFGFAQTFTISGYIQDENSGEKLIGANVFHEATGVGTVSNNYGFYSLSLPVADVVEITYTYIGYKNVVKQIKLTSNQQINIDLNSSIELDAVEVIAEKNKRIERETQMSVAEVPMSQLKKVPALLGEVDVLKALQLLPGVKSGGEGQSGLYVRGGGPDQNLILLDGVPVYNASHLFGFFSVFNADAIKDVKLIKGGYPARYGGRLSSVLEINMKDGNINEFKGTASIGLISSKLTLEGPLNKGKTSFIVSGRRTYLDVIAQPFIKKSFKQNGENGAVGYYFYDLNAKINHKFSDKDRIYLSSYGGRDKFYYRSEELDDPIQPDHTNNGLGWGNFTTALRWNHVLNPKMFLNTTATYSDYRLNTDIQFGSKRPNEPNYKEEFALKYVSGIEDFGFKVDLDYVPNPNHFLRVGVNVIDHTFKPGVFELYNELSSDNVSFRDTIGQENVSALETGLYLEDDWNVSRNFKVNAGLHFSTFLLDAKNYFSIQPRVSGRYLLPRDWSLKASFASMRQYINLLSFEGIGLPTDLWVPSTQRIKPQDSWQVAMGAAKTINDVYEFSAEVYYKKMTNLVAYKDGAGVFQVDDWQDRVVQGKGDSYGFELFLQRKEGRLSGWIGYTLAWAYRNFPDIDEGRQYPYRFDRRHDFSIVGNYNIRKGINLAATWVYGTGNAVTLAGTKYDNFDPKDFYNSTYFPNSVEVFGQRNNFRMRSYHRMDIGINFTKQRKSYERTISLGAYNAYAHNNPFFLYYGTEYENDTGKSKTVLKQTALFPLVPYITWTVNF